eukprot:6476977-Pyramimonas_sp.AAC.3
MHLSVGSAVSIGRLQDLPCWVLAAGVLGTHRGCVGYSPRVCWVLAAGVLGTRRGCGCMAAWTKPPSGVPPSILNAPPWCPPPGACR